jgi:hypothetical protein
MGGMIDRPSGAELLAEARRVLLEELLDLLPPDRRYDARMIANAMAIAARELEATDAPLRAALRELSALYGESAIPGPGGPGPEERFVELSRRLAADIRAGLFDAPDPRGQAVRDHLRAVTAARLRLSNPKALAEE